MTTDAQTWMLAIVFLAQIIVLSFFVPARMRAAYLQMFVRYPQDQYPRLYPLSVDEMRRWQRIRQLLHIIIGCVGFAVLVVTVATTEHPRRFSLVMTAFTMIQLIPTMLMAVQNRKLVKEIAKMAPPAKRSASLHAWRITDFVSPRSVTFGFVGSATALGTATYLYSIDTKAMPMLAFSATISLLLLFRMLQIVFLPLKFKRPDPYMSQEDVFRRRQQGYRMLFRMAASLGAYSTFMMFYSAGMISFDYAYIAGGGSILIQALALRVSTLTVRLVESTDFTVYREPDSHPSEERPSVA